MSCWCVVAEEPEVQVPLPVHEIAKAEVVASDEASTSAKTPENSVPFHPTASMTTQTAVAKEAPSNGSFEVMMWTNGKKLGLEVDGYFTTARNGVVVKEIKAGAIKDFNDKHPKQAVQIYDELTSMDEATGAKEIGKAVSSKSPDMVNLTLVRPRKIQVTLDSKAYSVGVVIKEVLQKGLVADWNSQQPLEDQLRAGDRIVENNGKFYEGEKMMKQLKSETALNLTVLKYELLLVLQVFVFRLRLAVGRDHVGASPLLQMSYETTVQFLSTACQALEDHGTDSTGSKG
eukprot:s3392_g10.t1